MSSPSSSESLGETWFFFPHLQAADVMMQAQDDSCWPAAPPGLSWWRACCLQSTTRSSRTSARPRLVARGGNWFQRSRMSLRVKPRCLKQRAKGRAPFWILDHFPLPPLWLFCFQTYFNTSIEDILAESDSDLSENEGKAQKKTGKVQKGRAWLKEGEEDEPLNFLDPKVSQRVLGTSHFHLQIKSI